MSKLIHKELSYAIMQATYEVHNQLGPGLLEKLYERALIIELLAQGHKIEQQKAIIAKYKNQIIGKHILDLIVDKRIILELKAVATILPIHKQQALSYLKVTGHQLAIIINFGSPSVQSHRVVNTKQ
ncbi:MAG: GxxExxY protein [Anaerolineae bacterium]|nr:GxxExxY protein [Anaerolineae bacterium]MBT7189424.1 GxxExxY protein [Anaerolineae bacterium]MBT7990384.1 GxxExxY protein [Anaerolineae bacterium]